MKRKGRTSAERMQAGAELDAKDNAGRTPLHYVGGNATLTVTRVLFDAGAQIEQADVDDKAPLHYAAEYRANPAVIQSLLDAGADPNAKKDLGETPLDFAEDAGNTAAVELLRDASPR